jgi:hypothetical protein
MTPRQVPTSHHTLRPVLRNRFLSPRLTQHQLSARPLSSPIFQMHLEFQVQVNLAFRQRFLPQLFAAPGRDLAPLEIEGGPTQPQHFPMSHAGLRQALRAREMIEGRETDRTPSPTSWRIRRRSNRGTPTDQGDRHQLVHPVEEFLRSR